MKNYRQIIDRLDAMEDFLYYEHQGGHLRTNGGWCIDSCPICEKKENAYQLWQKVRKDSGKGT